MNIYHLDISYDNKLFIPVDVPGGGNCLFRTLVETGFIPIGDSKTFHSDLSICTEKLLKNGLLHGRQIRNYFNNNDRYIEGGSIEDYIGCVMSVKGKWGSTFEMICVSIIYRVRVIGITNISDGFMVSDTISLLNAY